MKRSGQAHALPLPPLPATLCALPCADDVVRRPPAAAWVSLGEAISLRVVVNRLHKQHAQTWKIQVWAVEMGKSRLYAPASSEL